MERFTKTLAVSEIAKEMLRNVRSVELWQMSDHFVAMAAGLYQTNVDGNL
jgi:hypothetical protein